MVTAKFRSRYSGVFVSVGAIFALTFVSSPSNNPIVVLVSMAALFLTARNMFRVRRDSLAEAKELAHFRHLVSLVRENIVSPEEFSYLALAEDGLSDQSKLNSAPGEAINKNPFQDYVRQEVTSVCPITRKGRLQLIKPGKWKYVIEEHTIEFNANQLSDPRIGDYIIKNQHGSCRHMSAIKFKKHFHRMPSTTTIRVAATGLTNLMQEMLHGDHIRELDIEQLQDYLFKAGTALHNLPGCLANNQPIQIYQLKQIDELDPSGTTNGWGNWVRIISHHFCQNLPDKRI